MSAGHEERAAQWCAATGLGYAQELPKHDVYFVWAGDDRERNGIRVFASNSALAIKEAWPRFRDHWRYFDLKAELRTEPVAAEAE